MIDNTIIESTTPDILQHMVDVFGPGEFDSGNEDHRFVTFVSNRYLLSLTNDFNHNWKLPFKRFTEVTLERTIFQSIQC